MAELIALSGSIRKESYNEKLAILAIQKARSAGIDAEYVDLRDYSMPIYNSDLDNPQTKPENVRKLRKIFIKSNKIIICSPEHNASVSPLLKNVIDWVSRKDIDDPKFSHPEFRSKAIALLSASPGNFAGIRGLNHLRAVLNNLFAIVIPEQLCIPKAHEAFDNKGQLKNTAYENMLQDIITSLMRIPVVS